MPLALLTPGISITLDYSSAHFCVGAGQEYSATSDGKYHAADWGRVLAGAAGSGLD